jgi:hypothetical protein
MRFALADPAALVIKKYTRWVCFSITGWGSWIPSGRALWGIRKVFATLHLQTPTHGRTKTTLSRHCFCNDGFVVLSNHNPQANIKTHHKGAFEYWLCYLCSSRAELMKIGQEIDKLKGKLKLPNLH